MSKLQELMAARMDIEKRIDEMQREARSGSIAKVRALMAEFGLTAADISGKASGGRVSGEATRVRQFSAGEGPYGQWNQ